MQIANPIYDSVFKYLLEDKEAAMLLISTLLEEELLELDFLPQESTTDIAEGRQKTTPSTSHSMTTFRMDFAAKIKSTTKGTEVVIIELQKARLVTDTMRFRNYLGKQYSKESNSELVTTKYGKFAIRPLPIKCVFFLGSPLQYITNEAIIKVKSTLHGRTSGKLLKVKEPFIESITHECTIVVIPELSRHQSNEIEKMLQIFDQVHANPNGHLIEVDEALYPAKYAPLVNRLYKAAQEPKVRETMDSEDFLFKELRMWDEIDTMREKKIKELTKQKENALKAKEEAVSAKEEANNKIKNAAEKMLSMGNPLDAIAEMFGMEESELNILLNINPTKN